MILRLVAFVCLGISPLLFAGDGDLQAITLKDNSVIRARVTGMSGGFYFAKSPALGDIKIAAAEVVSIQPDGAVAESAGTPAAALTTGLAPAQPSPAGSAGVESLKAAVVSKVQSWASTREGMDAVMNFSQNPAVKAIMNDPQIMQAIQNGDYPALMKSPAIKALLDSPQTKSLMQGILKPQAAPPASPAGSTTPAE
jgi:hypothetical protein